LRSRTPCRVSFIVPLVYSRSMVEAREDIEKLLLIDRLPRDMRPLYDTDTGKVMEATLIRLEPPWNSNIVMLQEELRSEIVQKILSVKEAGMQPLSPFTIVKAHEVFANRDLALHALLVHPEFVPLCAKAQRPLFGIVPKLFEHYEIPPGEIYGVAQPEFVGAVPITREGVPGVALTNLDGIVWGRFSLRAGV
jgi:hypothetical protein